MSKPLNRRRFIQSSIAAGTAASTTLIPFSASATTRSATNNVKKKMAVVTTTWWERSHAWHMATRFLVGYPKGGKWLHPEIDVVSAYVDQVKDNDLSHRRAKEFGFNIYPTVAEAVRNGKDKIDVDCVLLIGEHGDYEQNAYGQKLYPRYRLFNGITDVFRADGISVPVFNDKHLSWNFEWAQDMVTQSEQLGFPLLAGSSLPVTWRMPSIEMPFGAEVEEALIVAYGGTDIYDFHALETLQCMLERRKGGETGVHSIHAVRGVDVWRMLDKGSFAKGGWSGELFEACLSRSQTLAQSNNFSHRYPSRQQFPEFVTDPIAYRIIYRDGTRATMLLLNGLVTDFTFAAKLRRRKTPLSTLFYLPPNPNVVYSAALMDNAKQMFMTGKAPYNVKRTLLTSGMVQSALTSLHLGQALQTPHLDVEYIAERKSSFYRN